MKRILFAWAMLIACGAMAQTGDVLGAHDLSTSGVPGVKGKMSAACLYCHAPHSGQTKGPLWSQQYSSKTYSNLYASDTLQNKTVQPEIGKNSSLCLSCHDGTVAPGTAVPYGKIDLYQQMSNGILPNLEASHPFSLQLPPFKDAPHLVASLASNGTTADITGAVKLVQGNVECNSCHEPHNYLVDKRNPNFLVIDNTNGALCTACHETKPRSVNGQNNPLEQWTTSVHAKSDAAVSAGSGLGGYTNVGEFACSSCHASHDAGNPEGLMRKPGISVPNVDATSQSCITCHAGGSNLVVPITDVFALYQNKASHPFPSGGNTHKLNEPVVLDQNRHAGCADCHDSHGSQKTQAFTSAPNLRPSQNGAKGVASDGTVISGPATRQYETCLRCHGNSIGAQAMPEKFGYLPARALFTGDPLNLIPQFGTLSASSHPVMNTIKRVNQFSLRTQMLDLGGINPVRTMNIGEQIFCTDCHNNDQNREFGGAGPNGPHGSVNDHVLERPYLMSQVTPGPGGGPGSPVINLVVGLTPGDPRLNPGTKGPYDLCAKCHDLNSIMSDASFKKHSSHISYGFSCSTCHTSHGVPSGSAGLSGQRLVNFDVNVVAPYNGTLAYTGASCTLSCHGYDHNAASTSGTQVSPSTKRSGIQVLPRK